MATGRWGSYARTTTGKFVNKDDWAEREVEFYITGVGVREAHGKFKPEWELTVRAEGEVSTTLTFSQGTGGRDEAIESAAADLENGVVEEIGPVMLVKVRTTRGNPFFAIEEVEDGDGGFGGFGPQSTSDNTGADRPMTRMSNQVDDDLPF